MVMIPEADADGAAGSGQDSCHGVEVDQHICYSLQDELFVHDRLTTSVNKNKDTVIIHHFQPQLQLKFLLLDTCVSVI